MNNVRIAGSLRSDWRHTGVSGCQSLSRARSSQWRSSLFATIRNRWNRCCEENADLAQIDGVGKDLAEKSSRSRRHTPHAGRVAIAGARQRAAAHSRLGPKKAATLYRELKISTLEQLKAACDSHVVRELKGFGRQNRGSHPRWNESRPPPAIVLPGAVPPTRSPNPCGVISKRVKALKQLELAGSYRRAATP